jgi:hypothetical protein
MDYRIPTACPVCSGKLFVSAMTCPQCGTALNGTFAPCRFCALDDKLRLFLDAFLKAKGSIKEVERSLGISYPTVKGLLDELLHHLYDETVPPLPPQAFTAAQTIDLLEAGKITVDQAAALLAGGNLPLDIDERRD